MKTDVLIIGGGLSGLHTAHALHERGVDVLLVEARGRLGGRILSRRGTDANEAAAAFDLGPTWFWPGQRRIEELVLKLGLGPGVFDQPSAGDALYENQAGVVQRGLDGVSMAGSFRLDGGLGKIITSLAGLLPAEIVWLNARATHIVHGDRLQTTVTRDGQDVVIDSARVVIALPPRIAAGSIELAPALPAAQHEAHQRTPTWMAGSAKVIALYNQPFWRADGLSGDAISYRGPLGEIHDASPRAGGPAALFGFVGVPPTIRQGREDALQEAAVAQLERLFGHHAATPLEVLSKDWAFDPMTATEDDREARVAHPLPWAGEAADTAWGDTLVWSGSETATGGPRNNGYLEGALEASARTVRLLEPVLSL